MSQKWCAAGSNVWVLGGGWYARQNDGRRVSIQKLSTGIYVLAITVNDNRWTVEQRTEHRSLRSAKAQATSFLAALVSL